MNAFIDIRDVVLKTKRLIIRPWQYEDVGDLHEYASVEGIGDLAGWSNHKDIEESMEVMDMFISNKNTFALEYNGKAIGSLGIELYPEEKFIELKNLKGREIGFSLSKDHWGKGFMPEAVDEVNRYLFEALDLDFIMAGYFPTNERSKRVQEKCGFKFYGRGSTVTRRGVTSELIFNILWQKDWIGPLKVKSVE